MSQNLDHTHLTILKAIEEAQEQSKPIPTYKELIKEIPYSSLATIHKVVKTLIAHGYVNNNEGKMRGHTITQKGQKALRKERHLSDHNNHNEWWNR